MTTQARATFEIESWDETPYDEADGAPRLSRATVKKSFTGDIEGRGRLEYLLFHREDGSAAFVGLERVVGRIGDRAGTFVLQHTGTFEGGTATAAWEVVAGSGTNQLRGLRGEGGFSSSHAPSYPMTLDYHFEEGDQR